MRKTDLILLSVHDKSIGEIERAKKHPNWGEVDILKKA